MRVLSLLFCIAVLVFASSLAINAAEEVVLVQFTHRHGARTPIVPESLAKTVCGDVGCGELNFQGEMMLTALGNYIHDRYATGSYTPSKNNGHPVAPSSIFNVFASGSYQVNHMYTRSTDVNRTIQSATAVLRGLSSNMTTYYPIVHTTAIEHDNLLLVDNALSQTIPLNTENDVCLNSIDTSDFETTYLPIDKLKQIATSLSLEGHLTCHKLTKGDKNINFYDYSACILPMWDTIMSFIAMGRLTNSSLGVSDIPKMEAFDWLKRQCLYANTTKEQGAVMYNLVNQYVANMELRQADAQANAASGNGFGPQSKILYEYSAHDTTVAPLMVALGFPNELLPNFGQTMITELVNETTTGVLTVRHWYGAPRTIWPPLNGTNPDPSWYRYDVQEYPVVCWDKTNNKIKNVTDGSCTLEEFKMYVEKVLKPTDPAGAHCYLTDDMKKKIHCDTAAAPTDSSSPCYLYRTQCPSYACPNHFAVNTATLECIATKFVPVVSTGQAWAIASGTTVAGLVLGVAGTFIAKALLGAGAASKL